MKETGTLSGIGSRWVGVLGVVIVLVSLTGCATIITGSAAVVRVTSNPTGAAVTIHDDTGRQIAVQHTPCEVRLNRGAGYFEAAAYTVRVEKEGYQPFETRLTGSLSAGWYLVGNLIFGHLIGWLVVDPITGAMWQLKPVFVNANLAEQTSHLPGETDDTPMLQVQVIGEDGPLLGAP